MKSAFAFMLAAVVSSTPVAVDLDGLVNITRGIVPNGWAMRADSGAASSFSWVHFEHKNDQVLGFVVQQVPAITSVTNDWIRQASTEMFSSDGSARFLKTAPGQPIEDMVRHRIVQIEIGPAGAMRRINAIEYTYIYKAERGSNPPMGHGYCFILERTVFFVQHTARTVIASELAFGMAAALLAQQLDFAGKAYSVFKIEQPDAAQPK